VTLLALLVLVAVEAARPGGTTILDGVLWPVLVFASVVVHEAAHSLLARRRGIGVTGIVLLPIGGVSKLGRLPDRPADELAIAAVGPAASFGLAAVVAASIALLGRPLTPVSFVHGALDSRLVWANAMLAAFNLLPAFPLDGGRVLRAALARRTDLQTATHRAATLGRSLGWAMAALGVLVDVWLLVIGLFVVVGSVAEETATLVHVRLRGLHVADVMRPQPVVVDDTEPTRRARTLARWRRQPIVPVTHDGVYRGAALLDDLDAAAEEDLVGSVLDPNIPTVDADEELEAAVEETLWPSRFPAIPVLDHGRVAGVLTAADVQESLAGRAATERGA
jgi:Zn-dependent protease/CBS domain-containing protein